MKFVGSLSIQSDFLTQRLPCAAQSGDLGDRRGLVLDARRLTLLSLAFARARDFNGSITTRRTLDPWTSHFHREREHRHRKRRTVFLRLSAGSNIEAYCAVCNVYWLISESERRAISLRWTATVQDLARPC